MCSGEAWGWRSEKNAARNAPSKLSREGAALEDELFGALVSLHTAYNWGVGGTDDRAFAGR
jgi:hypothetical protein